MEEEAAVKKWDISLLYVEDDAITMITLSDMLRKKVRTLYIANDGEKGLDMYKQYSPDITLTDIRMPVMSGLEMSREILKIDSKARIIIITGYNDLDHFKDSIDMGIKQYVLKPMDVSEVFRAIDRYCELMQLESI